MQTTCQFSPHHSHHRSTRNGMALSAFVLLATACAPTIQPTRVAQVKRMAIVGFQASIQRDSQGGFGARNNTAVDIRKSSISNAEQAATIYARLGEKLRDKFGWQVLTREEVIANPGYQALRETHRSSGFISMVEKSDQRAHGSYYPEGIFTQLQGQRFKPADHTALEAALDVDAIAMAFMSLTPASGMSIGPFGSTRYAAQVTFFMYDRKGDEPIWSDRWAKGKKGGATKSINLGVISFGSGDKDMNAFYDAIENGYDALLERYTKEAAKVQEEKK